MRKLISLLSLCFLSSVIACSSTVGGKDSMPKTSAFAQGLRGMDRASVISKMGSDPAESMSSPDVAFYFLSEESEHHPAPKLVRYRFAFEKGVLVSVDPDHKSR